ncbi:hypothetical protein QC758_19205 [Halomonas campisalis]|uniref:hypothetical protein n=1 Tax=Billgrantia campisalis TaxID=74661 RepID=UPI001EF14A11|nr:hypothetical protein [Halomonas campisalis]MDR5865087.1 hypothetical protein [Halomonas campisalis]
MAKVAHEPVKRAMSRIRELSADEEARRLAFVRERALRDEVSFLNEAKREGLEEGEQRGRQEAKRETARNLIARTEMDDAMIAEIAGLAIEDVVRLREEARH